MHQAIYGKNLNLLLTRPNADGRILLDELSETDRRRVTALATYPTATIPLGECLKILFGSDSTPEAAQSNLRALRMRFNHLASQLRLPIRFNGDNNKRLPLENRSVWFSGPEHDTVMVEEFTRQSVSNLEANLERPRFTMLPKEASTPLSDVDRLGQWIDGLQELAKDGLPQHFERPRATRNTWWTRDSERQPSGIDAIDEMTRWARDPSDSPFCAVLGEYGMGKTTALKVLSLHLLELRKNDPQVPLPIYIDLRYGDATDSLTLEALLDEHVKRNPNLVLSQITAGDLIQSVRKHGSLIIFDGLDEKMVHMDPKGARNFLRVLWSILPISARGQARSGKIIFACRSHFFKDMHHQYSLLLGEGREGLRSNEPIGNRSNSQQSSSDYRLYSMLPFNQQQIRSYLIASLGDSKRADNAMAIIGSIHDLRDLAERPVLLAQIAQLISDLEQMISEGVPLNAARLYERIVALWFGRDDGKHQINPEHKRLLMQQLAAHLHCLGVRELPIAELEEWLDEYLAANSAIERAYYDRPRDVLKEDLRTATLLVRAEGRQSSGHFRFAHTSLQEYFLAAHLVRSAYRSHCDGWDIPYPSEETLVFFNQLLEASPSHQQRIIMAEWSSSLAKGGRQANIAFRAWVRAHALGTPEPQPDRVNLDGVDLTGLRVIAQASPRLVIPNASFRKARMVETAWKYVTMVGADFTGTLLNHSEFDTCILDRCIFVGTRMNGVRARLSSMIDINVDATAFQGTQGLVANHPDAILRDNSVCRISLREGSSARLTCCSISNDGTLMLGATQTSELVLWSIQFNTRLRTLHYSSGAILTCGLSADGRLAVCGGRDRKLHLWEVETGALISVYHEHSAAIIAAGFSSDGRWIISASVDGAVHIWNSATGVRYSEFGIHSESIRACAVSPDGQLAAIALSNNSLVLWDTARESQTTIPNSHDGAITCLAASAPSYFYSASEDRTIKAWDGIGARRIGAFHGHVRAITSISVSSDGARLFSCSTDHSVRMWDTGSRRCVNVLHIGSDAYGVTLAADAHVGVLSNIQGDLQVLDTSTGDTTNILRQMRGKVLACSISEGMLSIAASCPDSHSGWSTLSFWFFEADTGRFIRKRGTDIAHDERGTYLFSRDARKLFCCNLRGDIGIVDTATGGYSTCCPEQQSPRRTRDRLKFSAVAPGENIIACGWENGLEIWDLHQGTMLYDLEMDEVAACGFSSDGRRLFGASPNMIASWDAVSGEALGKLDGSFGRSLTFEHYNDSMVGLWSAVESPMGSRIILYRADSGANILECSINASRVCVLSRSREGPFPLIGSLQSGLQVWDPDRNQLRFTVHILPEGNAAVLSSDDGSVLSATSDAWRYFDALWESDRGAPTVDLVETVTGSWPGVAASLIEVT